MWVDLMDVLMVVTKGWKGSSWAVLKADSMVDELVDAKVDPKVGEKDEKLVVE